MLHTKQHKKPAQKKAAAKKVHKTQKRKISNKQIGALKAPFTNTPLPYAPDALGSTYSAETLGYHHGKHTQTYVNNLNNFVKDKPELAEKSLEQIIVDSKQGPVFNNAAQIHNHTLFFHNMKPSGGGKPSGALLAQIEKDFTSFDNFAAEFKKNAVGHFGSGWVFLAYNKGAKKLAIEQHHDASSPLAQGNAPIMTIDVWEHSYYIDHRNVRANFVDSFMNDLVNWEYAEKNFNEAV